MHKEYDFSNSTRNPYAKKLKKQIRLHLEPETLAYFKQLAAETDISPRKLITLFLQDCVRNRKKPSVKWKNAPASA